MPIAVFKDSKGTYFRWGLHGAKYYFIPLSTKSVQSAYWKALRQMKAIYASGYRGNELIFQCVL